MLNNIKALTLIGAVCLSLSAHADRTPDAITKDFYSITNQTLAVLKGCAKEARAKNLDKNDGLEYVNKCTGERNNGIDLNALEKKTDALQDELRVALKKQGVPEKDIEMLVKGMGADIQRKIQNAYR